MKKTIIRLAIGAVLFVIAIMVPAEPYLLKLAVYLTAYLEIGYKVLWKAIRNISRGKVFDENFLMALASVGAMCMGDAKEAVAVMLFYQTGELFQDMAVVRSRKSIAALMDIRPDYANLEDARGELHRVAPDDVPAGSIIVTKPDVLRDAANEIFGKMEK